MMNWLAEFTFAVPSEIDRERFEAHVATILESLTGLDGIQDPDGGMNYSTGEFTIGMYVEGSDYLDALARVVTAVRTGVHTAGGSTPGWEKLLRRVQEGKFAVTPDTQFA